MVQYAAMLDRYDEHYGKFRWELPARFNIAKACCGRWAEDRARFALYWEDESGATAAYSFRDIQIEANRLSNALAALGVKKGDCVAIILPQRPETAIAYMAIFQMGAVALPLSHLFGPDALEYRMEHAEAKVAIVVGSTNTTLAPANSMRYSSASGPNRCDSGSAIAPIWKIAM